MGSWYWIGVSAGLGAAARRPPRRLRQRRTRSADRRRPARRRRGRRHRLRDRELAVGRLGRPRRRHRRRLCRRARRNADRERRAPARRHARRHSGARRLRRDRRRGARLHPGRSGTSWRLRCPRSRPLRGARARALRRFAHARAGRVTAHDPKLVLDRRRRDDARRRSSARSRAAARRRSRFLAEHGDYRRATSVFPSLTPVCLSSIVTGAGPGRAPHPAPRLVEPAGAAHRRVRLVVRGAARGRAWRSRSPTRSST